MGVYLVIFVVLIFVLIGGGIIYLIDGIDQVSVYVVWGGVIIFFLGILLLEVILGMFEVQKMHVDLDGGYVVFVECFVVFIREVMIFVDQVCDVVGY